MAKLSDLSLFNDANLAAYWPGDNSGSDDSTNSNTMVAQNSATYSTTSKYGGYSFACEYITGSTSKFFKAPDDASLDIAGDLSISGWINVTNFSGGRATLASKWGATGRSWWFSASATQLIFDATDTTGDNGEEETVSATINTGTWYHIAVTYDNAGTVKFYLNGSQQGTDQTTAELSLANSTTSVAIGCNGPDDANQDHITTGFIDDVAIFSRVLTASEVLQIYTETSQTQRGYSFFM